MRVRRSMVTLGLFLSILLLAAPAAIAEGLMHARVSFENGNTMVKGAADADWSYATLNTIVMPGDTVWVDKEGTLELEMSGGTFFRMADDSKVDIVSLPPSGDVRVWTGSFYIERINRSSGDFVAETPVCKVSVDRDSEVRMDVIGNGATTVSVRWGRAVVRTEGGSDVAVDRGQRSFIDPGYLPSDPAPFDLSAEDDFDTWNRERGRLLATGTDAVPSGAQISTDTIGLSDLAPYGDWVTVDNSYYWHPTVVTDYVPYRSGYWSFVPDCGYVWVGGYPFSYVTSHYGRWWHNDSYGWLWSWRDTWGPAWVAGIQYGPDFVWSPLDPWDRPCAFGSDFFFLGGLRFGFGVSSFCGVDDLLSGPCFVRPWGREFFNDRWARDASIWNINIHGRDRRPFAFRDSNLPVRDFSPHRILRGPEVFGGHDPARTRVASLENRDPVRRFRAVTAADMKGSRTPIQDATRVAQPRSARLGRDVLANAGRPIPRTLKGDVLPGATPIATGERTRTIRSSGSRAPANAVTGTKEALPRPMRTRASEPAGGGARVEERSRTSARDTGRGAGRLDISKPSSQERTVTRDVKVAPSSPAQSRGTRDRVQAPRMNNSPSVRSQSRSYTSEAPPAATPSKGESAQPRVIRLPQSRSTDRIQSAQPEPRRGREISGVSQVRPQEPMRIAETPKRESIMRVPESRTVPQFSRPAPQFRQSAPMRAPVQEFRQSAPMRAPVQMFSQSAPTRAPMPEIRSQAPSSPHFSAPAPQRSFSSRSSSDSRVSAPSRGSGETRGFGSGMRRR